MNKPLLSVIVPVYNTSPWLRRCLDSICAQTYRNLEILCVNDGSTDNSAEILAEYAAKDGRIKVFTQKNAGLSAARNTALEHATGDWIAGVDSDDYLEPEVYERVVACVADEVDMVCFGVNTVTENGAELPHWDYFDLPEAGPCEMNPELAGRLNVCFWSKLWRRSLLESHNLRFPDGLVHEDNAMYCCALPWIRKVAFCSYAGYNYAQRADSIMGQKVVADVQVARNAAVYRFVAAEYQRMGLKHETSAYLAVVFHHTYAGLYQSLPSQEKETVRQGFYRIARELELRSSRGMDYRLIRLKPQPRVMRHFVQRHLYSAVVRFFKLPLWAVEYNQLGQPTRTHILLFKSLFCACKRVLSRLLK